jgi:hypothetical protein
MNKTLAALNRYYHGRCILYEKPFIIEEVRFDRGQYEFIFVRRIFPWETPSLFVKFLDELKNYFSIYKYDIKIHITPSVWNDGRNINFRFETGSLRGT